MQKTRKLQRQLGRLFPQLDMAVDYAWTGVRRSRLIASLCGPGTNAGKARLYLKPSDCLSVLRASRKEVCNERL
jgi:hypothetical protein